MSGQRLRLGIELIDDPGWMGGTLYLQGIVHCLARLPLDEQPLVRLIGSPSVVSDFIERWGHLPILRESSFPPGLVARLSRKMGLVRQAADVVDVVYPGFGPSINGAVVVRWIPDFQHRYLPELFSGAEIEARDRSMGQVADSNCVVVLSSDVAKADFGRFFPHHRATPRVWRFCSLLNTSTPADARIRDRFGLPEKFLYLPNQFWAHKNHICAFKALARLRREHGITVPLVCTGTMSDRRNAGHVDGLLSFLDSEGIRDQVHLLGLIEREEQVDVLRRSAAVVQPSLFEGWSTVVEDVRAVGRPIFLSDIPVHREQSPPLCEYFDPQSDSKLASLLAKHWQILRPGPDSGREEVSRKQMESRILEAARTFCEIMAFAAGMTGARQCNA